MQFTDLDVATFAEWSRDRNPLHVDPRHARDTHFGVTLAHGMLTVVDALTAEASAPPFTALDIEFRGAVVPGGTYEREVRSTDEGHRLTLTGGDAVVLTIQEAREAQTPEAGLDLSWVATLADRVPSPLTSPVARTLDELQRGLDVTGVYAVLPPPAAKPAWARLPALQSHVLMLASYVVGMEVPGLTSLFTRATVRFFETGADTTALVYRVRTVRLDRHFRLLDLDLVVATPQGRLVATARLRSYVPFSPVVTDVEALVSRLGATTPLRGKVALVCGASRGLGADIALALAAAGCHVYAAARGSGGAHPDVAGRGGRIDAVTGDVGDPVWCRDTAERIHAAHGGLDLLVLNACAPPEVLRVGPDTAERQDRYVQQNLRLVQSPLAALLPALTARRGCIAYVSSSYVEQPVAGFSAYIALKQAAEGMTRTVVRENPALTALILRPPPLQTRWNDTPTGAAGAIPADWVASHLVSRVGAGIAAGRVESLSEFPPFEVAAGEPEPARAAEFSIRVSATFTADHVLPGLRFWMRALEADADCVMAPYGQVLQALLHPTSVLAARGKALNVVLLRVRDWLRELAEDKVGDLEFLTGYLSDTARDFERAMRTHRASGAPETLLLLCPSYDSVASAENVLLRQVESDLTASLQGLPGLQIAAASAFHEHYDVRESDITDPLRDHIAHIPYKDGYLHVLAAIIARHAHRKLTLARKVVVVDCDNTLWGGVVGELGAEGLEFDEGHRALHRMLVRLTEAGVLVCLCSKNEEPDVWRVFETRPELGVPRESVVAAMINWQPKSQNLRSLAARLNLGLDSFVFLDDNPVECAEVRAGCPEVLTLQWPKEPEQAQRLLRHVWEFDRSGGTKEDQRRTQMYREEIKRQELRADTLTFDDFIKNLQLVVDASPLAPEDLKRAAQLTLRTNQFNFTTIRRDEAELQALVTGGQHEVRTIRVRDRFGDYGLVGLVIAERGAEAWTLDTFLLSCRVLGRGVEHRILADLGDMAQASGAARVHLRVEFTKRNTPARTFLESAIPAEHQHADGQSLACDVPSDVLRAVRFEPSAGAGEVVAEETDTAPAQAADTGRLRRREEQIGRTAFEWSDVAALRAAVEGTTAPRASEVPVLDTDIAATVHQAFASALRVPVSTVTAVDALEALGCDSMRVVEITVALSESFPWLPSTLLFEFRSVSDIVAEIASIAARREGGGQTRAAQRGAADPLPVADPAGAFDIAVVGMHVRCAGANSLDELWQLLSARGSAVTPVPVDREAFLQPLVDQRPHWAGLLDDVARFDAELFGVSPREAEVMDPQLRLFLEVAWGALEDAGYAGRDHEVATGVYAGVMYGDYGYRANFHERADSPYRCWEGFSLANRLSQLLGFQGPSFAVETACSSSATALHLACSALRAGECRAAVVGGVNLILDPDRFGSLGRLGILSPDGKCEPFGADANGTVIGEGAGVVVLKPLADALERGDRIYGVIKGTALSTGNGTVGFTAPNPQAQAEAIRRSLHVARIDPRTISYVETHGTGTALGDPIEVRGLSLAFGDPALWDPRIEADHRCAIGSVKPNIGHLEAGAGVMGLIKVLLQLHRGQLLPTITSREPSPHIPFPETPFVVQRELSAWQRPSITVEGAATDVPRRAGLNSFGVGGANAHLILEEAPAPAGLPEAPPVNRPAHLLAVSARSAEALSRYAGALAGAVDAGSADVADVAFTLNTGHRVFERRGAIVARDRNELTQALRALETGAEAPGLVFGGGRAPGAGKVAFVFTGQGSQYAGMGRALYDAHPVFAEALNRCAALADAQLDRPLLDLLFAADGSPDAELLNQTGYTQPALFAFEYALAQLWMSWGVRPDVVMGHSVGEIAAMCVAGAMTLEGGVTLIAARGRLMQALPAGGAMVSVMAGEAVIQQALDGHGDEVAIAALNGPAQTVISGAGAAVHAIAERLARDGVKSKPLTVSHAFHSPLMQPMLEEYGRVVQTIRFTTPRIPVVSCVTGAFVRDEVTQPAYWKRQVADPVRFMTGMRVLEHERITAFVEIGPVPVLLGMGRQCVQDDSVAQWLPSLRRDADAWPTMLGSLGRLFVEGVPVDWKAFDAPYHRRRVSVPVYAFGGRRYWLKGVIAPAQIVGASRSGSGVAAGVRRYDLVWREVSTTGEQGTPPAATCVVFVDRGDTGRAVIDALRRRGVRGIAVSAGQAFRRVDHERFEIDPDREADLASVYAGIDSAAGDMCVLDLRALDLDGVDAGAAGAMLPSVVMRAAALVRTSPGGREPWPVWFVTRGAIAVGEGEPSALSVAQAAIWGFARTASLEYPDRVAGVIDLAPTSDAGEPEALASVVLGRGAEDQIAIRGAARFVPRLVDARTPSGEKAAIRPDGAYLVTGGTGALGLLVAEWLVDRGARHLVLVSRSGEAAPGVRSRLAALESRGARITVARGDVSHAPDVDRIVSEIEAGPVALRGVVLAAGVDAQAGIAELTREAVSAVLAPKTLGTWLLHDRTRRSPLDLFVCFSSMASLVGAQGRAHYAAANAFVDALAEERRRLGLAVTSINWGPWAGGGMATDTQVQQFERVGNHALDPTAAVAELDALSGVPVVSTLVADIDWPRFANVYESRRPRPLIHEISEQRQAAAPERPVAAGDGQTEWAARVNDAPAGHRLAEVTSRLRQLVADTLGFPDAESVPVDRSFYEIGMDSLMMADLVSRLRTVAGISSSALVFDHPTVEALAPRLLDGLPQPAVAPGAEAARPAGAAQGIEALRAAIREEVKATLGFATVDDVRIDQPFTDMGMDSLTAAELAGRLQRRIGMRGSSLIFDHPTVEALSAHLAGQFVGVSAAPVREMVPAARAPEPDGVSGYSPAEEDAAIAFQAEAFPDRQGPHMAARWRWSVVDSARRLGVPPRVWVYRDHGRIVGQQASIPVSVKIGSGQRTMGWLVDTMVLPAFRERAVGTRLLVQAHDDQPLSLSLGQTAEAREICRRLGWAQVAPLRTAMLPVNPERVLRGKLPSAAAWAAGVGLRASATVRDLFKARRGMVTREIDRFDARHDALWQRASADLTCAVVRDASYLNWKYVDRPGQSFHRLDVLDGTTLVGCAVWSFRAPDGIYQYRRGFLVDVVASAARLADVVRAASVAAMGEADALLCLHIGGMLTTALSASGYHAREPGRFLLVDPTALSQDERRLLLDESSWFVTQGDSDIDRP